MILKGKCFYCKGDVDFDCRPMPKEDTSGRDGFFSYEQDRPHCGEELEGVLGPTKRGAST